MKTEMPQHKTVLETLNKEYIAAFMSANVKWYEEHLSEDFVCIESNGSILEKGQFLNNTAKGPDVDDYQLERVNVRIYGTTALVQATGLFTRKDWVSRHESLHRRICANRPRMESGLCTDYASSAARCDKRSAISWVSRDRPTTYLGLEALQITSR